MVFGFGSKKMGEKLIYVARITGKCSGLEYYTDNRYSGRIDRIYSVKADGRAERRPGYSPGLHTDPKALLKDVGIKFERGFVLLSTDFRYFGKDDYAIDPSLFGELLTFVSKVGRGYRVQLSNAVLSQLKALAQQIWDSYPDKMKIGVPHENRFPVGCEREASVSAVVAAP